MTDAYGSESDTSFSIVDHKQPPGTVRIVLYSSVIDDMEAIEKIVNELEDRLSSANFTRDADGKLSEINPDSPVILAPDSEAALLSLSGNLESMLDALHYTYIKLGILKKGPNGEEYTNGGAESLARPL